MVYVPILNVCLDCIAEVVHMRASETLNSATLAIFQAAPIMATLVIFAVYTVGLGKALQPSTAFAVVAWINVSSSCQVVSSVHRIAA